MNRLSVVFTIFTKMSSRNEEEGTDNDTGLVYIAIARRKCSLYNLT